MICRGRVEGAKCGRVEESWRRQHGRVRREERSFTNYARRGEESECLRIRDLVNRSVF